MKLVGRMGVLSLAVVGGASFAASPVPAAPPSEFVFKSSFLTAVAALDGTQMLHVDSNAGHVFSPNAAESDPTVGFGSATPVPSTLTPKASLDVDIDIASDDGAAGSVPEPSTWWLMLAGAGAVATLYSRRR